MDFFCSLFFYSYGLSDFAQKAVRISSGGRYLHKTRQNLNLFYFSNENSSFYETMMELQYRMKGKHCLLHGCRSRKQLINSLTLILIYSRISSIIYIALTFNDCYLTCPKSQISNYIAFCQISSAMSHSFPSYFWNWVVITQHKEIILLSLQPSFSQDWWHSSLISHMQELCQK